MCPVKYRNHAAPRSYARPVSILKRDPLTLSMLRVHKPYSIKSGQVRRESDLALSANKQKLRLPDRQPVGCRQASRLWLSLHTRSPPFAKATPVPWESSLERKRALARRTTIVRPESARRVSVPANTPYYNNSIAPINGLAANLSRFFRGEHVPGKRPPRNHRTPGGHEVSDRRMLAVSAGSPYGDIH